MRSIKFSLSKKSTSAWDAAVILTEAYLRSECKADQLLDELNEENIGNRRATCQSLFLGALRHGHRTRAALKSLLRKKAKPSVEAILLVTAYELIDSDSDRSPKIIHHAVERSKALVNRFEQGFLNAVLRKLPEALDLITKNDTPAAYYSHPDWLVARWRKEFPKTYSSLLEWNQLIPLMYLKIYDPKIVLPDGLEATTWPQFYRITSQVSWKNDLHPLLNQGTAYIKDPSTRLAPVLLDPQPEESILDLCAAPGGKAYDMSHAMDGCGQIVAVDLPGKRIKRLRENLESIQSPDLNCEIVESDLLKLCPVILEKRNLPTEYDAVMLDAPCSNTGVIQRRTDVKWRLQKQDIKSCVELQSKLLVAASTFVKVGGRVVYSTCSIEAAENQEVVARFLESASGKCFKLRNSVVSYPWETGHDGAGAFFLERTKKS